MRIIGSSLRSPSTSSRHRSGSQTGSRAALKSCRPAHDDSRIMRVRGEAVVQQTRPHPAPPPPAASRGKRDTMLPTPPYSPCASRGHGAVVPPARSAGAPGTLREVERYCMVKWYSRLAYSQCPRRCLRRRSGEQGCYYLNGLQRKMKLLLIFVLPRYCLPQHESKV